MKAINKPSNTSKRKVVRYYNIKTRVGNYQKLCTHSASSFCQFTKIQAIDMVHFSTKFNSFTSIYNQDNFLTSLITIKKSPTKAKSSSVTYNLHLPSKRVIRVCLQIFSEAFGIGKRRVRTISKKMKDSRIDLQTNRGGARTNQNTEHLKNLIRVHIKSFQTEISHYNCSNEKDDTLYLEENISISEMIADFNNKNITRTSYWLYYKIFSNEFNIKTKKVRQDVCDLCTSLQTQIKHSKNLEKHSLKNQQENHIKQSEIFYDFGRQ